MPRSSAPSFHSPLYREIIRESLSIAWHERHLWVLAILAGLIQTGGIYDVLLRRTQQLSERAVSLQTTPAMSVFGWMWEPIARLGHLNGFLLSLTRAQSLLWIILFGGSLLCLSIIAQGGLVYGLGIRLRGQAPALRACFAAGARSFWKVAAINIITLGLLWALGTLLLLPFGTPLAEQTWWTSIGALVGFIVYLFAAIKLTALHLLALNQIILQKNSVVDSLSNAVAQIRRVWVTIFELGLVFLVLGIGLFLGLTLALVIAGLPLILFIFSAALLGITSLSTLGLVIGAITALVAVTLTGAFAITVQYAAWQRLATRASQGTAVAKIHRWFHGFGRNAS